MTLTPVQRKRYEDRIQEDRLRVAHDERLLNLYARSLELSQQILADHLAEYDKALDHQQPSRVGETHV